MLRDPRLYSLIGGFGKVVISKKYRILYCPMTKDFLIVFSRAAD